LFGINYSLGFVRVRERYFLARRNLRWKSDHSIAHTLLKYSHIRLEAARRALFAARPLFEIKPLLEAFTSVTELTRYAYIGSARARAYLRTARSRATSYSTRVALVKVCMPRCVCLFINANCLESLWRFSRESVKQRAKARYKLNIMVQTSHCIPARGFLLRPAPAKRLGAPRVHRHRVASAARNPRVSSLSAIKGSCRKKSGRDTRARTLSMFSLLRIT